MHVSAVTLRNVVEAGPWRLGDYSLLAPLGRGGMAQLYVARDERNGELVAVKLALSDQPYERLIREARLSAAVRHRGVVRTRRIVRPRGQAPFMVMEYVEGLDLRELLGLCTRRRVSPPLAVRLGIVIAVLEALEAVHRARRKKGRRLGLIHRDISPSNVILSFDGRVQLCDFGIAIAAGRGPAAPEQIEGKAAYMSPEQARGEPFDRRADVYSVGVVAWELLNGRRMRRAPGRDALLGVAASGQVPPRIVRGISGEAELFDIVGRALSIDPRQRFATATSMRRALEAYCERHRLRADKKAVRVFLKQHFEQERARRPGAPFNEFPETPTESGIRRVVRRVEPVDAEPARSSRAALAVRAFALLTALVLLLHGLGAL